MEANPLIPIADIQINQIRVLNPRARSRRQKQALIDSIAAVGLKKPITVVGRCGRLRPGTAGAAFRKAHQSRHGRKR